ncbi:MAG: biotin transporter BioY [Proteobacteria bacterium]|nr:biotin transporter BioY [Pseudomonadota bacterium]
MTSSTTISPLINVIWATENYSSVWAKLLRICILSLAGTALLAVSAQLAVPIGPVPITMQTFAVLLIGATYGWKLGGGTLALYLAEGAIGLPVFANGASLPALMGPTAGYLFGFVAAAALVGWISERGWGQSVVKVAIAMFIGNVVIYLAGISWLSSFIGTEKAIELGMLPFLIGDGLKIALAVAVLPLAWKIVNKTRS